MITVNAYIQQKQWQTFHRSEAIEKEGNMQTEKIVNTKTDNKQTEWRTDTKAEGKSANQQFFNIRRRLGKTFKRRRYDKYFVYDF